MRTLNRNNDDKDPVVLDWCIIIFGLVFTIIIVIMLPDLGLRNLFDVTPKGNRLGGIPFLFLFAVMIIASVNSAKRIFNRSKKKLK